MAGMFRNCSSLAALDVSGWDTSSAVDMSRMFYGCSSLTTLDLSSFDTAAVQHMWQLFDFCTSLTTLALGERFAFHDPQEFEEYAWSSMPKGIWVAASDGAEYGCSQSSPNPIPNNVADTYTLKETMSNVEGSTILGR